MIDNKLADQFRWQEVLSINNFRAVIFDLDGTLIEFKFDVKEAKKAMILWLEENGFETAELSEALKSQEIIDHAENQWSSSAQLMEKWKLEEIRARISTVLEEYEFKGFQEAKALEHSNTILRMLKDNNKLTALVTNSGRNPVDYALRKFNFTPLFDLVITRNEIDKLKPHPDGLLRAIAELSVEKDEALYVGDSVIDIEAAKRAGMRSAGLSTGMYDEIRLSQSNPDYIIHDLKSLEEIVLGHTA